MMSKISSNIDPLKLMAGTPIAIKELGIAILQPTIKDISYMGEKDFFTAVSYFLISKENLTVKIEQDITDFEIFIYFCNQTIEAQQLIADLLILLIEDLTDIKFDDLAIIIKTGTEGQECVIDESNFLIIKEVFKEIFCLNSGEKDFNPVNEAARKIAEKLEARKKKLSTQKNEQETSILPTLLSMISIGSNSLSLESCLNMSIFQLYNMSKRFSLYSEYQMQTQALMQGAENIELVDWTKKI